jgi:hypothetical protein
MGMSTLKMVAAGDGSPSSPAGYGYLVVAHAVVTVLLLATLAVGVWQFMDWVVTPSCPSDAAQPLMPTSSAVAPSPVTAPPVLAGEVARSSGRPESSAVSMPAAYQGSAHVLLATGAGDCLRPPGRQSR